MKNLAGNKNCDQFIIDELNGSGISLVEVPIDTVHNEVPFSIMGKLGKFKFRRAWYYWVVEGAVPLEIAQELYKNPIGQKGVRVAGHCGCPPPEEWINWSTSDGKTIIPSKEEAEFDYFIEKVGTLKKEVKKSFIFSDNPESIPTAKASIDLYHIDSNEGLKLFADTLRKYGLDK